MKQRADSAYSEMEIPNGLQIEPTASPASSELSSSAPHAYCSDMDPLVKQALESGDRMKERPLSMGEPGDYLDNLDRFLQTNYECSFCPMEQPTFEDMLKHIKIKHPWYDLKIHKNIR
ncbi:hypothetical protein DL89DRAFT_282080 [Linderina pennispora]|uniref:Uncharacterized protein n=1 Tax=Linderina pennispora TaxID=61395 RepID=A0A1Y1WF64_9FUNG|nr:uncharacterized protein DL89DRAFT_282080 [Linderina pennispora]ORX71886.1 hypothetical protein DL89DRAFT_282080 [Linderina pennispora]